MNNSELQTQDHYRLYGHGDQIATALMALRTSGRALTPDDLAAFDQLHTGGAEATRRVIPLLGAGPDDHVLDVGSGLGGPARMLAAVSGARVTGIDLTPHFVARATELTGETNQSDRVQFKQASALALPFAGATFDRAWHIHMSMNIADKAQMYAEIFRVLKPGGRFVFYDPIRGPADEVRFPVPWAADPNLSFLVREDAMLAHVRAAGFTVVETMDDTPTAQAWFEKLDAAQAAMTPEAKARNAARQDPRFAEMSANHRRNLAAGAVRILRVVAEKLA
jgi:SAM-dependent methyltransferase